MSAIPAPKKATQFYSIDLASVKESVAAAKRSGIYHFVYISVAQYPTKIMAAYQDARAQGENAIRNAGLKATFIRPWYVVGPGHYWPLLFLPVFKLMEVIPSTSKMAKLLGLVSLKQLLVSLKATVVDPAPNGIHILEISDIKRMK